MQGETEQGAVATIQCMDEHGRPLLLEDRLVAIGSILAAKGLSQAVSTMNLMAFWDEAMSPFLGCDVQTAGFMRTPAGPRSQEVCLVLEGWRREGLLERHPDYDADLDEAENMTRVLLDQGDTFRSASAHIKWSNLTARDQRDWWNMVSYLLEGLTERVIGKFPTRSTQTPGIGHSDTEGDLRRCMQCDPAYVLPGWETAGPAAAQDDLSKLGLMLGTGLPADVHGNAAVTLLEYWRDASAPARPLQSWQVPFAYGLYLQRVAARRYPDEHGDWRYYEALEMLTSTRSDQDDKRVTETFYLQHGDERRPVGSITWRPLDGQEDWKYQRGSAEAELLGIDIVPEHRSGAVGSVLIRHAMTRNCRAAPKSLPGAEELWGRHGSRQPDGSYRLVRTLYTLAKPAASVQLEHASAPAAP